MFTWACKGPGYECSSRGDTRFSALYARMRDGRTIEEHYQCDVKGYDPGGTNWRLGKGKPGLHPHVDLWTEYLNLWVQWSFGYPLEMYELRQAALANGGVLRDCFAKTPINQAHALACILNEDVWCVDRVQPRVKTTVVNYRHEPCDVIITRPSCWGNPFLIGVHGSRADVVFLYELLVRSQPEFMRKIKVELRGKRLGCVCKPKRACHGDVLARIAEED